MAIDKERINDLISRVKTEMEGVAPSNVAGFMVPIEVSARHIHISQQHLARLFGSGFHLSPLKELSQPGQFAASEVVRISGPRGALSNVRILGPVRTDTQVEISMTDAYSLGITPEIRMSGDVKGSPGCIIWGPKGHISLNEGVIIAERHMHCTPSTASSIGIKDGDRIAVEIRSRRSGCMEGIIVRVSDKYSDAVHVDTDEANAFDVKNGTKVRIIKK